MGGFFQPLKDGDRETVGVDIGSGRGKTSQTEGIIIEIMGRNTTI